MSLQSISQSDDGSLLDRIKVVSGWCIEQRRRRARITQDRLASETGIAVRWVREIEGGNPKTSIDDHLRCASGLGLTTGYMLILMMFMERKMNFPRELLLDDLPELEERCIESIAEFSVSSLASRLKSPLRRTDTERHGL